jgi:hypothetical protein
MKSWGVAVPMVASLLAVVGADASVRNVVTYHYDTQRTGWDSQETHLTPATVASPSFGLLQSVPLHGQVETQPLLMTGRSINGTIHDVVYVETQGDDIYGIDAESGEILLHRVLGPAVPMSALPGGCNNNGGYVGINSTPVIDPTTNLMYLIAYTYPQGVPRFDLHALNIDTLEDAMSPVMVKASGTLTSGATYSFTPAASRQRAALLESQGKIYAAFTSFCDFDADTSRGWMLGWKAATLTPLLHNHLDNTLDGSQSPDSFFLTSIWMSGWGPAAGPNGNVFFATGNSDSSGTTYDPVHNLDESVVELSPDLSTVTAHFTPTDQASLDEIDGDFGSGGVMLVPSLGTAIPQTAVAAGKIGRLYLLNRATLGGSGGNGYLGEVFQGSCWCGPSYFVGSDGVQRIVTSGAKAAIVWQLVSSPKLELVQQATTASLGSTVQDPGFFTVVSSNTTQADTAIIWAVTRPANPGKAPVTLYAFNPTDGSTIYSGVAGNWPNVNGNANITPVVANGRVYVASYKQLNIFGLAPAGTKVAHEVTSLPEREATDAAVETTGHHVAGIVTAIDGTRLQLQTRDGRTIEVDIAKAKTERHAVTAVVGQPVMARGEYAPDGSMQANVLLHAKPSPASWTPDR